MFKGGFLDESRDIYSTVTGNGNRSGREYIKAAFAKTGIIKMCAYIG